MRTVTPLPHGAMERSERVALLTSFVVDGVAAVASEAPFSNAPLLVEQQKEAGVGFVDFAGFAARMPFRR